MQASQLLKQLSQVLNAAPAYRLWQAPFESAKFAPILRHNDLAAARHVLDVGCGPGTNCGLFSHAKYVGLDINASYVQAARRRYGRDFRVADVTRFALGPHERFDFVLANSLLHHLNDDEASRVLAAMSRVLSEEGQVHIIDLVLPDRPGLTRYLAKSDRGDYPRPLAEWRELFAAHFETVVCEPFAVTLCGGTLWELVYFKGRAAAHVATSWESLDAEPCHAT